MSQPLNEFSVDTAKDKVYRHNRLFYFVAIPERIEGKEIICKVGKDQYKKIPLDYFKRDWTVDPFLDAKTMEEKLDEDHPTLTDVFIDYFEKDDGKAHSYIHFDDYSPEEFYRFPKWKISTLTKKERDEQINPYTLIMPIRDELKEEAEKELELMNEIRAENEFIEYDDFVGFEFGLIKILEKKFLHKL